MSSNMFKEYRSMGYNDEFINKIKKQYPNTIFYVTEKIHGSNFSIIIDDKCVHESIFSNNNVKKCIKIIKEIMNNNKPTLKFIENCIV